jgi:hypothetical protein
MVFYTLVLHFFSPMPLSMLSVDLNKSSGAMFHFGRLILFALITKIFAYETTSFDLPFGLSLLHKLLHFSGNI